MSKWIEPRPVSFLCVMPVKGPYREKINKSNKGETYVLLAFSGFRGTGRVSLTLQIDIQRLEFFNLFYLMHSENTLVSVL